MSDTTRNAAKRRASFARAERIKREAANESERKTDRPAEQERSRNSDQRQTDAIKAERNDAERSRDKTRGRFNRAASKEERRQIERQRTDEIRRAESIKAAERRTELARKQTEQRRTERLRAATQREFSRKAEDRVAAQKKLDAQRQDAMQRDTQKRDDARRDVNRQRAEAFAKEREKRHLADQQGEHRRQTDRLRKQHTMQTRSFKDNENAGVALHAQKVKNIDLAEARELKVLDASNRTVKGRLTNLVRPGQAERQERAIIDRHEAARMQAHRNHEVLKDRQFEAAQTSRLRQAHERKAMFDQHRTERRELTQAHDRDRPRQIEQQRVALEATRLKQDRDRTVTQTFEQGRGHELKR